MQLAEAVTNLHPQPSEQEVAEPVADEVTDDTVVQVAQELSRIRNASAMQLALDIGELLFEKIFGADVDRMRANGRKDVSFTKLAACRLHPFSAMRLWRAVGVYELVRRMPGLRTAKNLSVSHLYVVLGLPHQTQEWLLRAANEESWSVQHLDATAAKHRPSESKRRSRSPTPPILRSLRKVDRLSSKLEIPVDDVGQPVILNGDQLRSAIESLERIRAWCNEVSQLLEQQPAEEPAVSTPPNAE